MSDSRSTWRPLELAVLTLSRLILLINVRMVYPFLPAFSRGLGVSLTALSPLMSLRGFIGVFAPLLAPISERHGRRPVLTFSLLLLGLGSIPVYFFPSFTPFTLVVLGAALAKILFDPAMQAYLGDVIPYRLRGRAVSVTEVPWSGAFLIGVPIMSFVIARYGWPAPFGLLGFLGLLSALVIWRVIPRADGRFSQAINVAAMAAVVRREPVIWAAAIFNLLIMTANELLLIVYGDWMERNFGLSLTSLGLATAVIGAADLTGELFIGQIVDHIGKRNVIIFTGLLASLLYFLVPRATAGLPGALVTLFLLFLFFEMTVVGAIPLMTEVVPNARGVVMSVVLAASGLGRGIGALLGQPINILGGFGAIGVTSSLLTISGILVLAVWVREGQSNSLVEDAT